MKYNKFLYLIIFTCLLSVSSFPQEIGSGSTAWHSLAISSYISIYTWGDGNNVPSAVNMSGAISGKTITAVACGYKHSLALTSDGIVYAWGFNNFGQLGNGTSINSVVPVAVDRSGVLSGKIITAIACGTYYSLVLTSDGKVYAWGDNSSGQLGSGNNTSSNIPVAVSTAGILSGKIIKAIACGSGQSLALASDGKVYAWGDNSSGQLGSGNNPNSNVPLAVNISGVLSGKTITAIACALSNSLALASNGTIYAWGSNAYGQLGNGNNNDSNVPVAINMSGTLSGKTINSITCGGGHSLVLASDGKIYSFGWNNFGQLGNGNNSDSNVPVAVNMSGVLSGKTITSLAGGFYHSIALASDGNIYAWGHNQSGELGNGSTNSSNEPVAVSISPIILGVTPEVTSVIPNKFELSQNYPNPFNPTTTIKYSIPSLARVPEGPVRVLLTVYDVLGNEVATLVNENKAPGNYEVNFDGSNLSSGVYFYKMTAGSFTVVKKLNLIK